MAVEMLGGEWCCVKRGEEVVLRVDVVVWRECVAAVAAPCEEADGLNGFVGLHVPLSDIEHSEGISGWSPLPIILI
jgi:uncharacterized protein YcbX